VSEWFGANVEALRALALQVDRQGSRVRSVQLAVNYILQNADWVGPDADRFRNEWRSSLSPKLLAAEQMLYVKANALQTNADDQERVSGGGGVSAPPAVPNPTTTKDLGSYPSEPVTGITLDDESLSSSQVYQGSVGDCWFLASLSAVVQNDPEFIRQHMQQNADGTWTVTMYRDGKPVEITVTPDVPENSGGGPNGEPNWVSIYEKAAASFFGGDYEDIDGDYPKVALGAITGKAPEETGELDLAQIRDRLNNGPVVVTTEREHTWWPFDDEVDDTRIVPGHAYSVDRVEEHDGQMMIHVVNPWGPDGGSMAGDPNHKVGDLWLTEKQYKENFATVSSVPSTKGR